MGYSVTPNATDYYFIVEEKWSIGEQNVSILQAFDILSHIVTEDFFNMTILQTNKYSTYFIVSLKVAEGHESSHGHLQITLELRIFLE